MEDKKVKFKEYFKKLSTLDGFALLKDYLSKSDLTTAPASTKFHSAYTGGLIDHIVNVTDNILYLSKAFPNVKWDREESPYLIGICHDLCKLNFYKVSYRNVKDDVTGEWSKKPFFEVDDTNPLGHGEKSVIILQNYIKLTEQEVYCIRYHMGAFGPETYQREYSQACLKHPEIMLVALADQLAGVTETLKIEPTNPE